MPPLPEKLADRRTKNPDEDVVSSPDVFLRVLDADGLRRLAISDG